MAGDNTVQLSEATFETEVLQSSVPVLVDFWAPWCGPCRMLAPTIDDLANEYQGRIKVGKLDVDNAAKISAQFGVQNIPTVILFVNGQVAQRIVGAKNKRDYKAAIDAQLTAAR